ncbi:hypothetical protein HF519_30160, partial [Pseudonocardia bannensis]|nr:hypothetical protein [Pseudonocardia bannensis]
PATAPDGGPLNRRPGSGETTWIVELRRLRTGLTDLRSRVEGLAGRVEEFTGHHTDLAAVVSEQIAPELAALRQFTTEELNRQAGQLDEVLTTLRREDNAPVNWPALTAEQARAQWPILAQWIAEVLVPWYEITRDELPDCWALHRPALVELSWLRSAHVQAYLRSSAPSVTGEWHLRWRPAVIERLSKVIDRHLCRPGEHLVPEDQSQRQTPPPPPARPGEAVRRPVPAGRQLALPEHWNANYTAAVEADLAWRSQREANQA